jgi:hypothetical protein
MAHTNSQQNTVTDPEATKAAEYSWTHFFHWTKIGTVIIAILLLAVVSIIVAVAK